MASTDHRGSSARRAALLIVAVSLLSALPAIAVDLNPGDLLVTIDVWPNRDCRRRHWGRPNRWQPSNR